MPSTRSSIQTRYRFFEAATLVFSLALATVAGIGSAVASGAFYVDGGLAACSDTGPGSTTIPYCTISAAASARGGAGTTIFVRPGVYREMVTVPVPGAPESPFVIQAVGSPVVVDGADDFGAPSSWSPYAGSVFLASAVTWSPLQVFADGARLTASTAAPGALAAGAYVFVPGQGLYVNVGGGNPGDHGTFVGRRLNGFRLVGKSSVTIDGFTILRTEDHAVTLLAASNYAVISNNTVAFANKQGINISASSNVFVSSNTVSDCNGHGIYLVGTNGATVQDNECFGNARPLVRAANGIQLFGSYGNLIQRNRLHDNQDTGLQLNSGSNANLCLQNLSWRNGDHGFDHQGSTGTVHVGEVAWKNVSDGFSISGGSMGTSLFDSIAADNGLTTHSFDLSVDPTSTDGLFSDSNVFWNSTSQAPVRFGATTYATVQAYAAATGRDLASSQADPRFKGPDNGDFHLSGDSPAIDSADSSAPAWPTLDADERARVDDPDTPNTGTGTVSYADRGAFEFTPINQPPDGSIDLPAGDVTFTAGHAATFAGSASDPDGNPMTYLWTFGGGAADRTEEDPGPVAFATPGIHTVTFTATDSLGLADPTPDFRLVTVLPNHAPTGHIDRPAGDPVVDTCQTVTFEASGTDEDGDLPLIFHWSFGGGRPDLTLEDPGPIAFNAPGTYTVALTVKDSLGLADPTPETRIVTVRGSGPSDEIHWTIVGQNAVTFDWRGDDDTIHYGLTSAYDHGAIATPPSPMPISSCGPFREARLTNLLEDRVYHYAIGAGPDHTFRTPPPRGASGFTAYVEGDIGESLSYANVTAVQNLIAAGQPAFTLMIGDLSYANDHSQDAVGRHFNDMMAWSRDAAYMPAWGNHEWDSTGSCSLSAATACDRDADCPPPEICIGAGDDLRNYKGRFDLPNPRTSSDAPDLGCCGEDWSWFDYGNVRFIAYPEPYTPGTWQAWAGEAGALMDDAEADPAIRFIVTFGHRPAYSSGHHPGSPALQGVLGELGTAHPKYVLNFNGHSHNYERTSPRSGVIHITDGGGGASIEQDGSCLYLTCVQPSWSVFRAMHLGPVRLRVSDTRIEGEFICGPAGGGTNDIDCPIGSVVDSFTIPPEPPEGWISAPAGEVRIVAGQSVTFGADGTDPGNYTPLTYSWTFGGGAPSAGVRNPGPVIFTIPGTHTVTLTVTNSLGIVDPTPDHRTVVVAPTVGGRPTSVTHEQ